MILNSFIEHLIFTPQRQFSFLDPENLQYVKLRDQIGSIFEDIVFQSHSISFQVQKPDLFLENLKQLKTLAELFENSEHVVRRFEEKRDQWVSLFCSKWIQTIESFLYNFSSFISTSGFSKAGTGCFQYLFEQKYLKTKILINK